MLLISNITTGLLIVVLPSRLSTSSLISRTSIKLALTVSLEKKS